MKTLPGMAPHASAFVLSFVIVGAYRVFHHNMVDFIKQVDRQLPWLNLTPLLIILFIPFPAALLGQHSDSHRAVALYGINLMLVNTAGAAVRLYATSRPHLAVDEMTPALSRFVAELRSAPILVYAAAIPWRTGTWCWASFCLPPCGLFSCCLTHSSMGACDRRWGALPMRANSCRHASA